MKSTQLIFILLLSAIMVDKIYSRQIKDDFYHDDDIDFDDLDDEDFPDEDIEEKNSIKISVPRHRSSRGRTVSCYDRCEVTRRNQMTDEEENCVRRCECARRRSPGCEF